MVAGALYGAAAFTPMVRKAFGQASMGDLDILNFALTLEYLEAAFYEGAAKTPGLSSEVSQYVEDVRRRGAGARRRADHDDQGSRRDAGRGAEGRLRRRVLERRQADPACDHVRGHRVSAYNGAAPEIESKDLLATAGGIVQVEARHAAAIRFAAGEDPAPDAFDPVLTEDEVLKAVQPFIQS